MPGAARPRQRNVLDRFDIDFSLCMYCGICIEVCPFDALYWTPEFEYAEYDIRNLLHDKDQLGEWMATVPPPPAHDPQRRAGQGGGRRRGKARRRPRRTPTPAARRTAAAGHPGDRRRRAAARPRRGGGRLRRARGHHRPPRPGRPLPGGQPRRGRRPLPGAHRRAGRLGAGADLRRRGGRAAAVRGDADPGADRRRRRPGPARLAGRAGRRRRRAGPGRAARRRVPLDARSTCPAPGTAERIGERDLPRLGAAVRGALGAAAGRPGRRDRAVPPGHRRPDTASASGGADAPGHPVRHRRAALRRSASTACCAGATRSWC